MGLLLDTLFTKALRSNAELMAQLPAGDVYNTSIPLPDEDADNAPVPYVIVTFGGLTNGGWTKDSGYEGGEDMVQIGIEIAARTRQQLASLAVAVRQTVRSYLENVTDADEDYPLVPFDYTFSSEAVQYDCLKPCYWQTLRYDCSTERD